MRPPCELSTVARVVTGRDSGTARVTSPSQVCSSESNRRRLVGRSSAWMLPADVTARIGPSIPVRKMGPAPLSQRTPPRAEVIRMLPPAVAAVTSPRALPTRMLPPEVCAETSPPADSTTTFPPPVSARTWPEAVLMTTSPPEVWATTSPCADSRRTPPPAVTRRAADPTAPTSMFPPRGSAPRAPARRAPPDPVPHLETGRGPDGDRPQIGLDADAGGRLADDTGDLMHQVATLAVVPGLLGKERRGRGAGDQGGQE